MTQYTLVQHSGFGYSGDPTFEQGLESRVVTPAQAKRVSAAWGVLFPSYAEAEAAAESWQYPLGYEGLVPAARGTFAALKIDGLSVYQPVRAVVG